MALIKFDDFKKEEEDNKLKDLKRNFTKNSVAKQQFPRNTKLNYNEITKKMDDLSLDEVEYKLNTVEESKVNESTIDYDVLEKIKKLPCYSKLKEEFRKSIDEYITCVVSSSEETGYDEGDTDHDMALTTSIQEIINDLTW